GKYSGGCRGCLQHLCRDDRSSSAEPRTRACRLHLRAPPRTLASLGPQTASQRIRRPPTRSSQPALNARRAIPPNQYQGPLIFPQTAHVEREEGVMLRKKRDSRWKYDTSSSWGTGYGFVGAGGGSFYLIRPDGRSKVQLNYLSAGAGPSLGKKLPKVSKNTTLSLGPKSYPSEGSIYILDAFDGEELEESDLTGFCTIQEAVILGPALPATSRSYSIAVLGIERGELARELAVEGLSFSAFGLITYLLEEAF